MSRANRILAALLVVQLAVIVALRLGRSDHKAVKARTILGDLKADKVSEIKIEDGERDVVIERATGPNQKEPQWILKGSGYPVDKTKVSALLGQLTAVKVGEAVATERSHHRTLEVASKNFTRRVSITSANADQAASTGQQTAFYLGSSPGLKKVHFRLESEDEVYVARELSTWDVGSAPSNWIDTSYINVDKDDVIGIRIENTEGVIDLSKGPEGKWRDAGDQSTSGTTNLDRSAVDSLVSSASSLALEAPVGLELKPLYGLDQALATVSLRVKTKKKADTQKDKTQIPSTTDTNNSEKKQAGATGSEEEKAAALNEDSRTQAPETYVLKIGAKTDQGYYAKSDHSKFVVKVATWSAEIFIKKKRADLVEKAGMKKPVPPPMPARK